MTPATTRSTFGVASTAKPWWASKGMIGGLVPAVLGLLATFKFIEQVSPEDADSIANLVGAALTSIAGVVAMVGRYRATRPIKPSVSGRAPASLLLLVSVAALLAMMTLAGCAAHVARTGIDAASIEAENSVKNVGRFDPESYQVQTSEPFWVTSVRGDGVDAFGNSPQGTAGIVDGKFLVHNAQNATIGSLTIEYQPQQEWMKGGKQFIARVELTGFDGNGSDILLATVQRLEAELPAVLAMTEAAREARIEEIRSREPMLASLLESALRGAAMFAGVPPVTP